MIRIKDTNLITRVKLVLVALMMLCLLPMPYGFYNLVRFISMIGFAILAWYDIKVIDVESDTVYLRHRWHPFQLF